VKVLKFNMTFVITLIGGIGNIIQTIPFMSYLKNNGFTVLGRKHKQADSEEICKMAKPSYHKLITTESVVGAVDKGSLLASEDGKALIRKMPEWKAWFVWHGFEPPEEMSINIDYDKAESPSRVIFAPCCKKTWTMKKWPHWNKLIENMPEVAVVGSKNDGDELQGNFIDLRETTSLRQLAGILANAEYVVAQECGIAHLSCAVGTKTYILYGGTSIVKNLPPKNAIPIFCSENFSCRPCQHTGKCKTFGDGINKIFQGCDSKELISGYSKCMNALSVYEVQKAISDHGDDWHGPHVKVSLF
jgi:hypothetical protein